MNDDLSIVKGASMKLILAAIMVFCCFLNLHAQYAVSLIPPELLEGANAVYRKNDKRVVINGPGNYGERYERVVTILNENGKGPDVLVLHYDMHSRVNFIGGEIYDARGNLVRRIRRRDLDDTSNFQSFSLYEDNRVMYFTPRISEYPYTVRYEYETLYNRGMFYANRFFPQGGYNRAVQQAKLVVEYPASMELMYRMANTDSQPTVVDQGRNRRQLTYATENVPALTREFRAPNFVDVAPGMLFSTDQFEFDGYKGNNNSWSEFGQWIWQLNQGRNNLPPGRVAFLQQLVKDLETDREKVKAIYEFLQANTRYVNIALGIGGFQPFDAATVDRTGYGDCKALTNYMMAMLQAVGIPSLYTLVYAGPGEYNTVKEDFPVSQFNHVILCVPLAGDTVWLECTSSDAPFGHLGDFTDDRTVLMITEEGGLLARTPGYAREDNLFLTLANISLDNQGHGSASIRMEVGGVYFSDRSFLVRFSPDNQQKWLLENLRLPNYTLNRYAIENLLDNNPRTRIEMDVQLRSLASVSGQRLTVPLNVLSTMRSTPPRIRNRKQPFEVKFPTTRIDTLVIEIPAGFVPENLMTAFELETEFGVYSSKVDLLDQKIIYIRRFETYGGMFAAEKYADYFSFYQTIVRADNQSLVFRRE
ncbi:MAG: DUF3857 domain-containing transglutaminase family protein [Bacteroidales bacterium]